MIDGCRSQKNGDFVFPSPMLFYGWGNGGSSSWSIPEASPLGRPRRPLWARRFLGAQGSSNSECLNGYTENAITMGIAMAMTCLKRMGIFTNSALQSSTRVTWIIPIAMQPCDRMEMNHGIFHGIPQLHMENILGCTYRIYHQESDISVCLKMVVWQWGIYDPDFRPRRDGSPGSTPFLGFCSDSPASHLLGTCYLFNNLRSTHTPSKYLRATYSYIYIYTCYVSTSYIYI